MPRNIATPPWTRCLFIAGLPPSSMLLVPIYTSGWRETYWSKVPRPWEGIQNVINALLKQRSIAWGTTGGVDFFKIMYYTHPANSWVLFLDNSFSPYIQNTLEKLAWSYLYLDFKTEHYFQWNILHQNKSYIPRSLITPLQNILYRHENHRKY